jgi:hypothetical protein
MNLAGKFGRNERVVGRAIAGESFLIPVCGTPVDMNDIFVLNPLADFIWQRLDGERTLERIVAEIVETFDVTAEQAGADAADFVGQLVRNGLAEEKA